VAALVASLAVAWLSTQTIQSFLREEIDQKFPAILASASDRLDAWYAQRERDIEMLAARAPTPENVGSPGSSRFELGANRETEEYLTDALERFPQYRSLFLLDSRGDWMHGVGEELQLPAELRADLGTVSASRVGTRFAAGGRQIQLVSAPIFDTDKRAWASLHAAIDSTTARAELQNVALSGGEALYVIGSAGEIVMALPRGGERQRYARPLPDRRVSPTVEVYDRESGEQVIGSALRFPRFGWTLAVEESYEQVTAPVVSIIRKILFLDVVIALVCCLLASQIARSIAHPIRGLSAAARRVAAGEPDVTFSARGSDEIGVLAGAFNEMMDRLRANAEELEENRVAIEDANVRLIAQNQELHRVNEVFLQLSITDDLTKLHNHRFFHDSLPREMKRSIRTGEPLSLILMDIDDFKKLNDRHGHSVGDSVLRQAALVMNGEVRDLDLLARYGGEEFALLASHTTLEGAAALAEKLRLAVAEARFPVITLEGPSVISITVSVGVAQFRGEEKALFNDADRALYRAKDSGKDCVVLAEDGGVVSS
jgi:diguanylate cyclase (GGDEF)-like protein